MRSKQSRGCKKGFEGGTWQTFLKLKKNKIQFRVKANKCMFIKEQKKKKKPRDLSSMDFLEVADTENSFHCNVLLWCRTSIQNC